MHMNGQQTAEIIGQIDALSPLPLIGEDIKIFEYLEMSIHLQRQLSCNSFHYASHIHNVLMYILNAIYDKKNEYTYSQAEIEFRSAFEKALGILSLADWSLDKICREMCKNKYYFAHQFKEYYALSPMQYLRNKKLEKAKQLLAYTPRTIAQIAEECGFSSSDYFSTAFRTAYNVSPTQYRHTFYEE